MLYKYVTPERIDIIQNLKIRFTPYNELNDPFECRFVLNPTPDEQEEAEADDYNAEWAQVEVWLSNRIGQLGMLCLSRTPDNLLMWSHYAANHKGLVIGFQEQHEFFNHETYYIEPTYRIKRVIKLPGFGTLCDVAYTQERTAIDFGGNIPFEFFFKKSLDWSYEQEVRIFRSLQEGEEIPGMGIYLFKLPPDLIRKVIIGAQASPKLEKQILDAIHKNNIQHIRVEKARLHRRNFNIFFESVHHSEGDA